MYRLVWTLDRDNFECADLSNFLDAHFHPELITSGGFNDGALMSTAEEIGEWGKWFKDNLPRKKHERFRFICLNTGGYHNLNHVGRACQKFVWPEFFRSFPGGRILLLELKEKWDQTLVEGQFKHARDVRFDEREHFGRTPQDMSGLQSDNFPFSALQVAAFAIYPLILFGMRHTSGDLTCIYVPPQPFQHSQMMVPSAFNSILWEIHHIFDDQWTFDGSRGPKSATPAKGIKPTKCLEYVGWMVDIIASRMADLLCIEDPIRREQLAMTFNRAACDGILAATVQLPYISKTFFFACIDKLANILVQIGLFEKDITAWKHLTSDQFLSGELLEFVRGIPSPVGEALANTVEEACLDLKYDAITPELLRDYRNSHHGYGLTRDAVERLFQHSGEINNDVTLLATPLVLHTLYRKW